MTIIPRRNQTKGSENGSIANTGRLRRFYVDGMRVRRYIFTTVYQILIIVFFLPIITRVLRLIRTDVILQLQIVLLFILASIFPLSAFAYYLFRSETKKTRLGTDLWWLGVFIPDKPFPHTKDEYDQYARQLYDRSNDYLNFIAQSTTMVLLTIAGVSLFFWPPAVGQNEIIPNEATLQAMRFGFLGTYVYSLQLIYRRYTTLDLQPSVYMNCAINTIAGVFFNYVAFRAIGDITGGQAIQSSTGLSSGLFAILAFSLGYFPSLVIRWFTRIAHASFGMPERRANTLPLGLVDGISQLHEVRLTDEGIDNIQNLASVDLVELLTNTRFSAQEVIEWVDQAVLYTYIDQAEIDSFRRAGVRTFTDFKEQWESCAEEKKDSQSKLFLSTPERLDTLYKAMLTGSNVPYICNYWGIAKFYQDKYRAFWEEFNQLILTMEKAAKSTPAPLAETTKAGSGIPIASTVSMVMDTVAKAIENGTVGDIRRFFGNKQELEIAKVKGKNGSVDPGSGNGRASTLPVSESQQKKNDAGIASQDEQQWWSQGQKPGLS